MKLTNLFSSNYPSIATSNGVAGKDFKGVDNDTLLRYFNEKNHFADVRRATSGAIDISKVTNPLAEIHNALYSRDANKLNTILNQLPRHLNFISEGSPRRQNYLYLAVRQDFPEGVDVLVHHGADVNEVVGNGLTPLLLAVKNDSHECAQKLIAHGASLTPQKMADFTYEFSLFAPRFDLRREYHDKNSELMTFSDKGANLSHLAVFSNSPETLGVLKGKIDLNAKTHLGIRPIQLACILYNFEAAQWLIENGAKTDVTFEGQSLEALVRNSPWQSDTAKLAQFLQLVKS